MSGTRLALGAVATLAAVGVVRQRGSRGCRHPNWPNWTAQDAAEAGAHYQGSNPPDDVRAAELDWRYESAYPIARLLDRMPGGEAEDWDDWLHAEDEDRTIHFKPEGAPASWTWRKHFTKWWLTDPTVEPIVIVEDAQGRVEGIWDGWHRTAASVTEGQRAIPAFVGRRRRSSRGSAARRPLPPNAPGESVEPAKDVRYLLYRRDGAATLVYYIGRSSRWGYSFREIDGWGVVDIPVRYMPLLLRHAPDLEKWNRRWVPASPGDHYRIPTPRRSLRGSRKVAPKALVSRVRGALTDDLRKPGQRSGCPTCGHCYVASEALWHLLGGPESGYTPQVGPAPGRKGGTHWWLRHDATGAALDPTEDQWPKGYDHSQGRGTGFLTAQPSKRAQVVIDRVRKKGAANEGHQHRPRRGNVYNDLDFQVCSCGAVRYMKDRWVVEQPFPGWGLWEIPQGGRVRLPDDYSGRTT